MAPVRRRCGVDLARRTTLLGAAVLAAIGGSAAASPPPCSCPPPILQRLRPALLLPAARSGDTPPSTAVVDLMGRVDRVCRCLLQRVHFCLVTADAAECAYVSMKSSLSSLLQMSVSKNRSLISL